MADIAKLKTKAAGKGSPPAPEMTNGNLKKPLREVPTKKAKIEFSVPEYILDEFAQEAGQRFGFKKGAKSDLFIAMWEEYQSRKSG